MVTSIDWETAKAAVAGGKFLGGGGGGSDSEGLETAEKALEIGELKLIQLSELNEDVPVVTSSAVGAPAAKEKMVTPDDAMEAYELYKKITGEKPSGVITNENGGKATTNGWILAAAADIPIIDAPCNGRAHPTAEMGSMGLSKKEGYQTWQVASGGNPNFNKHVRLCVHGKLSSTSRLVRRSAVEAGGLVTVIRNRVEASYLKDNAAVGAVSQAIEIGKILIENKGSSEKLIESLKDILPLEVICKGKIDDFELKTEGGFDVGSFNVKGDKKVELTFWNEYMTAEGDKKRLATFPDLISVIAIDNGEIKTSAELSEGKEVYVIKVDKSALKLGAGMKDKKLFNEVEEIIDKELITHNTMLF